MIEETYPLHQVTLEDHLENMDAVEFFEIEGHLYDDQIEQLFLDN